MKSRRELTAQLPLIAIAALAGAALASAGPPTNVYPALWLGMAVLAAVLERGRSDPSATAFRASLLGLSFGTGANLVALRFVPDVVLRFLPVPWVAAWTGFFLLAIAQGVSWAGAALVYRALREHRVATPLAFAMGVTAATFVPAVFPWSPAAGVTPAPEMIQLAEWIGERGVTFVMALSAGFAAAAFAPGAPGLHRLRQAGVALLLPLATFVLGAARLSTVEASRGRAPTATIALVQPATRPLDRWNPDLAPLILKGLTDATAKAEREGASLTVWPEAAYPYTVGHASRRCPIGPRAILPFGVRGPVLSGLVMTGGDGDTWNAAAICHTDGTLDPPQDKVHLLWFGEHLPLLDRIAWVREKFTRGRGLLSGDEFIVERAGNVRAAVLNCFEDTLTGAGREAMTVRPNVLVNVTNDGWFAGSQESELHLRLAALRAVESRRDLVRAVNLGMTSWVDAAGVVRARTKGQGAELLLSTPALLEDDPTVFDRFGDAPLVALLLLAAGASARRTARMEKKKAPPP